MYTKVYKKLAIDKHKEKKKLYQEESKILANKFFTYEFD